MAPYPIKKLLPAPVDDDEFENAVLAAANQIICDGSQSFTVKTIMQYTLWYRDLSTSCRISYVLRKYGYTTDAKYTRSAMYMMAAQEAA